MKEYITTLTCLDRYITNLNEVQFNSSFVSILSVRKNCLFSTKIENFMIKFLHVVILEIEKFFRVKYYI